MWARLSTSCKDYSEHTASHYHHLLYDSPNEPCHPGGSERKGTCFKVVGVFTSLACIGSWACCLLGDFLLSRAVYHTPVTPYSRRSTYGTLALNRTKGDAKHSFYERLSDFHSSSAFHYDAAVRTSYALQSQYLLWKPEFLKSSIEISGGYLAIPW